MPRKDYSNEINKRLNDYLSKYEISNPNDIASLRAMINLEIGLEKQQKALLSIDPIKNPKAIKDIQSSIRDATNSYTELQKELNIDRRKRKSEDDEDNPLAYIQKLQKIAPKFLASRLKVLTCDKCGQPLAKYFVYVTAEGAELGSIEAEKNPPKPYPFTLRVGCWKCEGNNKSHIAEISNEKDKDNEGKG